MAIDEERVRRDLNDDEARHFLAQAKAPVPADLTAFGEKLDEYLKFLEDHFALEANAESREAFPRATAVAIADRFRELLAFAAGADVEVRRLVATGIRYFVNPHDVINELENLDGFHDDIRILNFVIAATGAPVAPLAEG